MKLSDLNILDIGNTIQITGFVLSNGPNRHFVAGFPGEDIAIEKAPPVFEFLRMDTADCEKFLYQSDALEVELVGEKKAIVRKSQRQIDSAVSWNVFKRDGYRCRYCGRDDVALTVDHVILWEAGGPSVEANLVAADKKCNRTRGNMSYQDWIRSEKYKAISKNLNAHVRSLNETLIDKLPELEKLKVSHVRSR